MTDMMEEIVMEVPAYVFYFLEDMGEFNV